MTGMAKGVTGVNINSTDRSCSVAWTVDETWKTIPVLSTKTALLHTYTHNLELAAKGEYVWYFVAIDRRTGKVAWKKRAGAGGAINDNWAPIILTPEGKLIQTVQNGVAVLEDGEDYERRRRSCSFVFNLYQRRQMPCVTSDVKDTYSATVQVQ